MCGMKESRCISLGSARTAEPVGDAYTRVLRNWLWGLGLPTDGGWLPKQAWSPQDRQEGKITGKLEIQGHELNFERASTLFEKASNW